MLAATDGYIAVTPLPDLGAIKLPTMRAVHDASGVGGGLVSVRYDGVVTWTDGRVPERAQVVATADPVDRSGNSWFEVTGTLLDAAKAAQHLALRHDDPWYRANGQRATGSASILQAAEGRYLVGRNIYLDPHDDDMAAHISMPIDIIPQRDADVAYPYGRIFEPHRVEVKLNHPDLVAVVGANSWASLPMAAA